MDKAKTGDEGVLEGVGIEEKKEEIQRASTVCMAQHYMRLQDFFLDSCQSA